MKTSEVEALALRHNVMPIDVVMIVVDLTPTAEISVKEARAAIVAEYSVCNESVLEELMSRY